MNHLISDNICNIINHYCQILLQGMILKILGLHLVLMTLHMQFTVAIAQDK
jgi:hypothetical protein